MESRGSAQGHAYFKVKVSRKDGACILPSVSSEVYRTTSSHPRTNSLGLKLHLVKIKYFRPGDKDAHISTGVSFALKQVSNRAVCLDKIHSPGFRHCPAFGGACSLWFMDEEWFSWKTFSSREKKWTLARQREHSSERTCDFGKLKIVWIVFTGTKPSIMRFLRAVLSFVWCEWFSDTLWHGGCSNRSFCRVRGFASVPAPVRGLCGVRRPSMAQSLRPTRAR